MTDVPEIVRGLDEDCADGLHDYCLTDGCTCFCHIDPTGHLIGDDDD